jgi:hypothetical protein
MAAFVPFLDVVQLALSDNVVGMLLVCSGNICEDRCLVICCEIRSSIDQFVRFRLTSNGSTTAFEKKNSSLRELCAQIGRNR